MKKMKLLTMVGLLLAPMILSAAGAGGATGGAVSTGLSQSGTEAKGLFTSVIQAFQWGIAFVPLWSAWFFSSKMKEYLENKEEQGQYEPKAQKNFKIVMAIIVGIIAAYLVIGIMAKVFVGQGFNEAWTKFVTDVWKSFFGI